MPELISRLPLYVDLILKCIESSTKREQLFVCMDFIDLFGERFRPIMPIKDFAKQTHVLFTAYNKKFYALMPGDEIHTEKTDV